MLAQIFSKHVGSFLCAGRVRGRMGFPSLCEGWGTITMSVGQILTKQGISTMGLGYYYLITFLHLRCRIFQKFLPNSHRVLG